MRRTITLICILSFIFAGLAQSVGCAGPSSANTEINASEIESKEPEAVEGNKEENDVLVYKESEELKYAKEFAIDYYEGGYTVLNSIQDDRKYLLVPEGKDVPGGCEDFIVIKRPVDDIYLVASAAMDMVVNLDALDSVKFSGQKEDNWYITEAREAMEKGDIVYAGKYNKPDYETIYMEGCKLAIENTMIYHSPEVLEQFDKFEIPYIVDYSSYENHPLARVEWIKFYGALLGCEEKAKAEGFEAVHFDDAMKLLNDLLKCAYRVIDSKNSEQVDIDLCSGYITSPLTLMKLRIEIAKFNFGFFSEIGGLVTRE